MFLTRTTTLLKHLQRIPATRTFSMSALRAAEGDTGALRSGGTAQGDAFTKREQASEDYYVRQEEKKKLEALRQKIAEKEADIAKDREEAEKLTKGNQ
jgi:hypothetical protein